MHTVTVQWGEETRVLQAPDGKTLLELLAESEIILSAPCHGNGKCGKCRVELDGKKVLACKVRICGDLRVRVPRSEGSGVTGASARPMGHGDGLGIALDIGTTTLAAALVDCATGKTLQAASKLNPQRVCGADVISRIAACGEGKLELLTRLIRSAAGELIEKLLPSGSRKVDVMTVCGNTTMLHLFCGVDPSPIGVAPYVPAFTELREYKGAELGLGIETVYILPSVSGYIGSDVVCGILALEEGLTEPRLLADLGTNGELALMLEDRIICASTAAGPALEGADIECGIGGVQGAVCAVSREGDTVVLDTIGDAEPVGICGSGLVDLMAALLRCGAIDETGALDEDCGDVLASRIRDQRFLLTDHLWLSQRDVRQFQLAKAAIHAGIETLCESAGISGTQVARLYIAGGLGYHLREESTLETGLIPRCFTGKLTAPGNTALAGAVLCLLPQERERAEAIARKAEVCELSCRADFSQRFIEAMCFDET